MKDANTIRTMLLDRLLLCLRSPGMCGGEQGLLSLMEYITFIDERESEWRSHRKRLSDSGAFRSTGIHGGFWSATGQSKRDENQPASVYALIAHEMGYLEPNQDSRILSSNEFDAMSEHFNNEFFDAEWTNTDVLAKFGNPSFRWGTNNNYPCILLYLDDSLPVRFCYFDCWAEFFKDETGCSVPQKFGPKPILRNIRLPADSFVDQFRFTRFGMNLKSTGSKCETL